MRNTLVPCLALISLSQLLLHADAVTEANARACAIVSVRTPPGPSRRVLAVVQTSVFEAVNAITARYGEHRLDLGSAPGASVEAAVFAATRTALLGLIPADKAAIEAWYGEALSKLPDGPPRAEGIALGERAAAGVLALRAQDGAMVPETYRPQTTPGVYVPTVIPAAPQWPGRKPWLMVSASQFRPGPPPTLASETWAHDFNEVKARGGKASTQRSQEQTVIGKFWEDNSSAIYFGVLRSLAEVPGRDITDNARLYEITAIALDDAIIAVFDAKYAYRFWRPLTAIRNGDVDGNDATEREPGWSPLIETPMHPEYPCAHCILAATLAEVVDAALPKDQPVRLSTSSLTLPGVVRSWTSTAALVEEVSNARVWSGVHYRNSTRVGEAMGHQVGRLAARQLSASRRP
ncbi:MAG TPA: vanadium-dependent haloperoxidase [Geothrix sp.]|nr:vanadium-dependent haloperoxidase [Geothrix sp.]